MKLNLTLVAEAAVKATAILLVMALVIGIVVAGVVMLGEILVQFGFPQVVAAVVVAGAWLATFAACVWKSRP